MKLKSDCYNSEFKLIENDPDEWILNLEGMQIQMNEFVRSDEDFMIYFFQKLHEEYMMSFCFGLSANTLHWEHDVGNNRQNN